MAKIIGDSDCISTIKHYLLSMGIKELESSERLTSFLSPQFQIQNKELYYGALGEEEVINTLRKLPDTYYILNEIHIKLTKGIRWNKYAEYVKSAQIDHVVIGETGVFLIETKNWKEMKLTSVHNSPHKQIDRAGMLFWVIQQKRFHKPYKSFNLVVTIQDLPKYNYKYVYQLPLVELNEFILTRKYQLKIREIEQIKNWLRNLRVVNPKAFF
jgi:hypothetical protein